MTEPEPVEGRIWEDDRRDEWNLRLAKAAHNRMIAAMREYERYGHVKVTIVVEDIHDGLPALYPKQKKETPLAGADAPPQTWEPGSVVYGTPITNPI